MKNRSRDGLAAKGSSLLLEEIDSLQWLAVCAAHFSANSERTTLSIPRLCSMDDLYSTAYTFIDNRRAIPATKLISTSSYKLGFYRYIRQSRTSRNITTYSIYIVTNSEMTQHDTGSSRIFLKVTLQSSSESHVF